MEKRSFFGSNLGLALRYVFCLLMLSWVLSAFGYMLGRFINFTAFAWAMTTFIVTAIYVAHNKVFKLREEHVAQVPSPLPKLAKVICLLAFVGGAVWSSYRHHM